MDLNDILDDMNYQHGDRAEIWIEELGKKGMATWTVTQHESGGTEGRWVVDPEIQKELDALKTKCPNEEEEPHFLEIINICGGASLTRQSIFDGVSFGKTQIKSYSVDYKDYKDSNITCGTCDYQLDPNFVLKITPNSNFIDV